MGARIKLVSFGTEGGVVDLPDADYRSTAATWERCLNGVDLFTISGGDKNMTINPQFVVMIEEI